MNKRVFFELVEMKAKTASVLPFLLGICYSWYHYRSLHMGLLFTFFAAMFVFNMAVDILDNYNDYIHARDGHDYRSKTNIIGRENLSLDLILKMIFWMIGLSALTGIFLSTITGWPLFLMGLYCYLIGIFYSSGPKPLSSLPLGEFFSGFTMGFMITWISVFINSYDTFSWSILTTCQIFLVALPNSALIANLMLANNICDLKEDEQNHRFTLVHYLGKTRALQLFAGLNILTYLAIILAVVLHLTPGMMLLVLLTIPFNYKQTQLFMKTQVKRDTFHCAVSNLAMGAFVQVVCFAAGIFIS